MKNARGLIRVGAVAIGLSAAILIAKPLASQPEVGSIDWPRDFEAALAASTKSGKPVFAFFQEVPGCAGCQKFGATVMTDPIVTAAIESEFEPVLIYNNRPGKDAELLERFGEPAWNYQVIRFFDGKGEDIIPRRDRVWTRDALIERMIAVLKKSKREIPNWLSAEAPVTNPGEAAFAMFCFWTGELKLGEIDGVITTEAGWHDGREVTKVVWDRDQLSFAELVARAERVDCANKVYPTSDGDKMAIAGTRLKVGELDGSYRRAKPSDQKKQLQGTRFAGLNLSERQATKVNAFARTNVKKALEWLTPAQLERLGDS